MKRYECYLPILKALCDETRLSILHMLDEKGELCACRIQDAFHCTQPTISYHMRVLMDAGLVIGRREGCLVCYQAAPGVWEAVTAFFATLDGIGTREE